MSPEPAIERYEVITPKTAVIDNYGNLAVTTTTGQELRVNKKHESLHPLFYEAKENSRALKLGYAVYLNKEYVQTAELLLFDGQPPTKQTEPTTAGVSKPQERYKADPAKMDSIEVQVAVKAIVELRIANALTDKSPEYQAMLDWCRQRLGIIHPKPSPEAV